jgi:hypothetical protein
MSLVRLSFELGMAVSDYNCGITNDHNAIINATFMYLDKVKVTLLTDDELVECYAIIGQMWASVIERPSEPSVPELSVPEPSVREPSVPEPSVREPSVREPSVREPEVKSQGQKPKVPDTKGKAPEGKSPQVKAPEGKAPEGKAPEGKAPEVKAPEVKAPEAKEKSPESKGKVSFQSVLPSLSSISSSIQLNAKGKVELPPPSGSIQLKSST